MRIFNLKGVSPVDGIGDFVEHWRQPTPYRWRILGLSVALTFTVIVVLAPKSVRMPPAQPNVIWINSWRADRSEKEILETNLENQKRKDAQAALDRKADEARRNFYRNLARGSGMDPDELAREFGQPQAKATAKPAAAPAAEATPAPAPAKPSATATK
jgi:hypothetical protein